MVKPGQNFWTQSRPGINSIINLKDKEILEFGAGTGRLTFRMSPYARESLALKKNSNKLATARGKHRLWESPIASVWGATIVPEYTGVFYRQNEC